MSTERREPLPLASAEDLRTYALTFGLDDRLIQTVRLCPVCESPILALDNGWLDAKAAEGDGDPLTMGVMRMGSLNMMCSRDPGQEGSAHTIHVHQPNPEEDLG